MAKTKRFNLTMPVSLYEQMKEAKDVHHMVAVTTLLRAYIRLGLRFTQGRIAIYHIEEDGSETPARLIL